MALLLSDDITRILLEVVQGKAPATPDTPDQAVFREKLEEEVAQLKADGKVIEVPFEMPDPSA